MHANYAKVRSKGVCIWLKEVYETIHLFCLTLLVCLLGIYAPWVTKNQNQKWIPKIALNNFFFYINWIMKILKMNTQPSAHTFQYLRKSRSHVHFILCLLPLTSHTSYVSHIFNNSSVKLIWLWITIYSILIHFIANKRIFWFKDLKLTKLLVLKTKLMVL